jgi:hypothetical protein
MRLISLEKDNHERQWHTDDSSVLTRSSTSLSRSPSGAATDRLPQSVSSPSSQTPVSFDCSGNVLLVYYCDGSNPGTMPYLIRHGAINNKGTVLLRARDIQYCSLISGSTSNWQYSHSATGSHKPATSQRTSLRGPCGNSSYGFSSVSSQGCNEVIAVIRMEVRTRNQLLQYKQLQ